MWCVSFPCLLIFHLPCVSFPRLLSFWVLHFAAKLAVQPAGSPAARPCGTWCWGRWQSAKAVSSGLYKAGVFICCSFLSMVTQMLCQCTDIVAIKCPGVLLHAYSTASELTPVGSNSSLLSSHSWASPQPIQFLGLAELCRMRAIHNQNCSAPWCVRLDLFLLVVCPKLWVETNIFVTKSLCSACCLWNSEERPDSATPMLSLHTAAKESQSPAVLQWHWCHFPSMAF